jgi:hypothetical protein
MATDYDAPRRNEADELGEDSLEELKARRAEAGAFTQDFLYSFAVTPPIYCGIIDRGYRNNPNVDGGAQRLLVKQATPPSMHRFRQYVDGSWKRSVVGLRPIAQGQGCIICSVAIPNFRGNLAHHGFRQA